MKFEDWGEEVNSSEYITKEQVQEMIDDAIRKHNRNASVISMCAVSYTHLRAHET